VAPKAIVLFDGECNFCNGTVQFILDRDPHAHFSFASLQSAAARELLASHGRDPADLDTVVLIEGDAISDRSTAALRIARRLRGPVRFLYAFVIVPRALRDLVYRAFAKHRYRLFGRSETCRVPTAAERARFVDAAVVRPS
jgi:predicted DCC family thiol-disulfide oxidoreductase YuxK